MEPEFLYDLLQLPKGVEPPAEEELSKELEPLLSR
uniref:Parvin gamma n=4 Tax=Homininae TaxID=207598 RepID=U3KQ67_HUMAN